MKLPERLLYDPHHENKEQVTDKALTRSIVISVFGILLCITCLFGLTWAWFSDSIVASSNKITAATFDLEITVTEQDTENTAAKGEDGYYTLDAAKTYTVSIAKLGTAKTGFCLLHIKAEGEQAATPYYTERIPCVGNTESVQEDSLVFSVSVTASEKIQIKFTPKWGECPEQQEDKIIRFGDSLSFGAPAALAQVKSEPQADSPAPAADPSDLEKTQPDPAVPSTEQIVQETEKPNETADTPQTTDTPAHQSADPSVTETPESEEPEQTES